MTVLRYSKRDLDDLDRVVAEVPLGLEHGCIRRAALEAKGVVLPTADQIVRLVSRGGWG